MRDRDATGNEPPPRPKPIFCGDMTTPPTSPPPVSDRPELVASLEVLAERAIHRDTEHNRTWLAGDATHVAILRHCVELAKHATRERPPAPASPSPANAYCPHCGSCTVAGGFLAHHAYCPGPPAPASPPPVTGTSEQARRRVISQSCCCEDAAAFDDPELIANARKELERDLDAYAASLRAEAVREAVAIVERRAELAADFAFQDGSAADKKRWAFTAQRIAEILPELRALAGVKE